MADDFQEKAAVAANRLVQACWDCASTLRTAAEVAETVDLRKLYRGRASDWARFVRALQHAIRNNGGVPPAGPSVSSTLRRAWIKIHAAVGDADAIAAECAKREGEALHVCTKTMDGELTIDLRQVLEPSYRVLLRKI